MAVEEKIQMKRLVTLGGVVLLSTGIARGGQIDQDLEWILEQTPPDQVISTLVHLQDTVDLAAKTAQLNAQRATRKTRHEVVVRALQDKASVMLNHLAGLRAAGRIERSKAYWINNVVRVDAVPAEIVQIAQRDDVAHVYYNYPIERIKPTATGPVDGGGAALVVETGIVAIRAPEAWALGYTGEGTLVSTLDTGVDGNHPALASRWQGLDPAYAGHPEWAWFDPVTNTTFPQSFGSHGTHTMGTVCGGLPGEEVGVAPGARWIHAATIDRAGLMQTITDSLDAFEWVIDPDGNPGTSFDVPDVCSNSWGIATYHSGADPYNQPCNDGFWAHLDACEAAGIVIVFAAGNEGSSGLRRPSAVAAVNGNVPGWPIAGFSSLGPTYCTPGGFPAIKPDIAAPGVDVRSCSPGGGYYDSSGTSMSAPHICGVVALMRQANPDLGVEEIKQIIFDTAYDLGSAGEDNSYGWGMVDAYEAVQQALLTVNLTFEFPDGLPSVIDSGGGTTFRVIVSGAAAAPVPGTGLLHYSTGGDYTEIPMQETSPNEYEAIFPSFDCPATVSYYFSAEADSGDTYFNPASAPDASYSAPAWAGTVIAFQDQFETDLGWIVDSSPSLTAGAWERGVPAGTGDLGDPTEDADGSGQCYVTGLAEGSNVDDGRTTLTSPILDATDPDTTLGYWRWVSTVTDGFSSFDYMRVWVSDDGGANWSVLETVGPGGPDVEGGWIRKEFFVADLPNVTNSDQVQVRFVVADYDPPSNVEAGVDGVEVFKYVCEMPDCPADIDGDGEVGVVDFLALLAAWGPNPGHPADIDGDGEVGVVDFLALLAAWGPCP
jgi:subtilisin family serine protease